VRAWLESGVATADQVGFHSRYVARLCARLRIADGTLDERARAALGVVS
jgi:hypothetical protein